MAHSRDDRSGATPALLTAKVLLGTCGVLAVIGGALLVVQVVMYFAADRYVPELGEVGGWGTLAGAVGLGIYIYGMFRANVVARIGAGLGFAGAGYLVTMIVASVVSLAADPGGQRGNLEEGAMGAIWLLAGGYFVLCAAMRIWPVRQQRDANETPRTPSSS